MAKLDRARGSDAAATKKLDEAQSVGGQDEKTRAAIALARNDAGTAIELYRSRLARSTKPDEAAKAHNDLGAALASAGKDAEAVAEYRKAIDLAPTRYDARMNLGALLSRLDRNEEAIAEFEAASKIQPKSVEPLVYAALTYQLMNRWPEALAAAQRAYEADPKASNLRLTSALRMPYKETNFQEWLAFLKSK
jgi:tetratricopeptide (TPR) repeat protein